MTERLLVLHLTRSAHMALLDLLVAVVTDPDAVQVYVDVVRGVETTPQDLLALVASAVPDVPPPADTTRRLQDLQMEHDESRTP